MNPRTMQRLLRLVLVAAMTASHALAEDTVNWGEPVNGLRLGLRGSALTVSSDQTLTFTVLAQNISTAPIVLPTLDTFLLKSGRDDKFRQTPLMPVLEPTNVISGPVTMGTSSGIGPNVDTLQEHTTTLAPGQTATWNNVPLGRSFFAPGPMIEPFHKAIVEVEALHPGSRYHLRYQFGNDQASVAGTAAWTGQADSGNIDLTVNAPDTSGIKVHGGFSLQKETYDLGEPITAKFTVTNVGESTISFPAGGDYRAMGRHDRFSVHAFDAVGLPVADPMWWKQFFSGIGGGLGGQERIAPGETYHEDVDVDKWCDFEWPGHYTIQLQRTLNVTVGDSSKSAAPDFTPESSRPAVPITSSLEITIVEPIVPRLMHFGIGLGFAALGLWHIVLKVRAARSPQEDRGPLFNSIFIGPVLCGIGVHYLAAGTGVPVTGTMGAAAVLVAELIALAQAKKRAGGS
jgi:hypothetical protein